MTRWGDGHNPFTGGKGGNGQDPYPNWRDIEILSFRNIKARLDTRPLVKGVLEHEQLSLIFGETSCGKTFLALDLSFHIAADRLWLDHKVDQGATVYIAAEAGRSIQNRVAAFKQHSGLFDIPFFVVTSPVDLCHADTYDLQRLIAKIKEVTGTEKKHHITIDTVSRALAGGNENSPDDMGAFVKSMDVLRDEFGAHITGVHHTGKDRALGARGHSLLKAAIDTEIEVISSGDYRSATITKQRDGQTGAVIPFLLRGVELGRNADGDPVYSCVVEAANGASRKNATPDITRLSDKQKIVLAALRQALTQHGEAAPPYLPISRDISVVSHAWWKVFYMKATSADDHQSVNTRNKAWREARDAVIAKGLVGMQEDNVWLT